MFKESTESVLSTTWGQLDVYVCIHGTFGYSGIVGWEGGCEFRYSKGGHVVRVTAVNHSSVHTHYIRLPFRLLQRHHCKTKCFRRFFCLTTFRFYSKTRFQCNITNRQSRTIFLMSSFISSVNLLTVCLSTILRRRYDALVICSKTPHPCK
jgi:hypothetical protein